MDALLKRSVDVAVALSGLITFLPLLILVAILVKVDSNGSPLFIQTRVGRGGKPFKILKFRTLYTTEFGVFLQEEIRGSDSRVTRFGKIIRRTKLDELPQLINVLIGNMTLVGPRPDIPEQVFQYSARQRQRLAVTPGLTGIAQVSGNTWLTWSQRIVLDLWYIENRTVWVDRKRQFHHVLSGLNSLCR